MRNTTAIKTLEDLKKNRFDPDYDVPKALYDAIEELIEAELAKEAEEEEYSVDDLTPEEVQEFRDEVYMRYGFEDGDPWADREEETGADDYDYCAHNGWRKGYVDSTTLAMWDAGMKESDFM